MKKVLAILLAVICAFSACVMAVATYDETVVEDGPYDCQYCDLTFRDAASLADHVAATYPCDGHVTYCGNTCDKDFDGVDEVCPFCTKYVAEMEAHKAVCAYEDDLSNWDKALGYLKAGDVLTALKYAFDGIVEFLKSDDFKNIINTVVDFVKGIDFDSVISTVKGVVGNIDVDAIVAKVEEVVA